ncbi:DUF523 domain-containing protein [archaeon SCG-AAA382B04]|nr:DUF523 domain-containing protein [archaeon SCG-AAA382B04]
MKICSACLLGLKTRYDEKTKTNKKVCDLIKKETLIPVCPEQLGGLPTPRKPSEPTRDGNEIIKRKGKVITEDGENLTQKFLQGARETYKIAKKYDIKKAILKQGSPSCGVGKIPNGNFNSQTTKGDGVTTAYLKKKEITVISEEEIRSTTPP